MRKVGIRPLSVLVAPAGQVVGVIHAQHVEDILAGEVAQAFSAHVFDDMLQGDEVEATVLKVCLRFEIAFTRGDVLHQAGRVRRTVSFLQLGYRGVGRQTGGMRHQIGNADDFLLFSVFALPILETGDVEADGVEHAYLAALCQYHDANGSRHGFAARGHVENGVRGHRLRVRIDALVAVCFQVAHFPTPHHGKYGAGNLTVGNGRLNGFVGIYQFA